MISVLTSRIGKLLIPLLLLAAAGFAIANFSVLTEQWQSLLSNTLPIISLTIGLFLCIQFSRSRYILLLGLLITVALLSDSFQSLLTTLQYELLISAAMINGLLFSLTKDRNLLSIHGVLRVGFIGIQVAFFAYLSHQHSDALASLINTPLFTLPSDWQAYNKLPNTLLIITASVCLLHLLLSLVLNDSLQSIFFGCQLGILGMASGYQSDMMVPFLLSSCSLMVVLSVLMDSYHMAYRDELTGLPSRRALNQLMLSLGRNYTIAMMDIDHFKKFNDTHGHDVGDEVLRMVATKVGKVTGGGKPFRFGGEEFTVVFPGKSMDQVNDHLEELREVIDHYEMIARTAKRPKNDNSKDKDRHKAHRGKGRNTPPPLSVAISIGLAERNTQLKKPEQVLKAADEALYRAKKGGRNRISR